MNKIECTGCGKYFSSNSSFDFHRIGTYHPVNTRKCMTEVKMYKVGMDKELRQVRTECAGKDHLEEHEVWFSIEQRDRARNAFSRDTEVP